MRINMSIFLAVLCCCFFSCASNAEDLAAPLEVKAAIESVVVYESGAKVTKKLDLTKLNLEPGSKKQIVFDSLPFSLSGVKVEMSGDSTIVVSKLRKDVYFVSSDSSVLDVQVLQLQDELKKSRQELEIVQSKIAFVKNVNLTLESKEDLQRHLDILSEKLTQELTQKGKLEKKIADLEVKFKKLTEEQAELRRKKQRFKVFIDLDIVEIKNDAYLKLIYIVDDATFEVSYDARIILDSSTLEIAPKIRVKNNSGQDWKAVDLSLHGGVAKDDIGVPTMDSVDVASFLKDKLSNIKATNTYMNDIGPQKTILFGEEKEFVESMRTLNAEYKYVAFPSVSTDVYFKAITTNDSEDAYMPGPLSLFLGRNYIGERHLEFTPPFSPLEIYVDRTDTIMVSKTLLSKSTKEEGIFEITKKHVFDYRLLFRNFADTHLTNVLEIIDILPVVENEKKLQFEAVNIAPIEIDKKKGMVKWSVELFPGVEGEIDYRLSVTSEN